MEKLIELLIISRFDNLWAPKSINTLMAINGKINRIIDYKQIRQFVGSKTAC